MKVLRMGRLSESVPPEWAGVDDEGNPVYMLFYKGWVFIRRGDKRGGIDSAMNGEVICSKHVDCGSDPDYDDIRRLCRNEVALPETPESCRILQLPLMPLLH